MKIIKDMHKLVLAIILLQPALSIKFSTEDTTYSHTFLDQFGAEKSDRTIEEYFQTFAQTYLGGSLRVAGNLKDVIYELATFNWDSLEDAKSLNDLSEQTLQDEIDRILSSNEASLKNPKPEASGKYKNIVSELKSLTGRVLVRAIQLGQGLELENYLLTAETLRSRMSSFFQARFAHIQSLNSKAISDIIVPQLEKANADYLKAYNDMLEFQMNPSQLFFRCLHGLFLAIEQGTISISAGNRQVSLDTLTTMIWVASGLPHQSKDRDTSVISYMARTYIHPLTRSPMKSLRLFFTDLYDNLLQFFYRTHKLIDLREAKTLVVEFFLPENYVEPPAAYIKFLMVKFKLEGFKDEALVKEMWYQKLREVYIVDLLYTSLFHQHELMTEKEVQQVITNFKKSTGLIDVQDMTNFRDFRNLLIINQDLLEPYEEFFRSFYNVGLFYVQYASWGRGKGPRLDDQPRNTGKFALDFDYFLLVCWKGDGGFWNQFINARIPEQSVFDISILQNYPAYKIINMQAALGDFTGRGVQFADYEDLQDKNIEQLLFENPRFSDLVLAIKGTILHNTGLNFGVFKGLKILPEFWKELRTTHSHLFPDPRALLVI